MFNLPSSLELRSTEGAGFGNDKPNDDERVVLNMDGSSSSYRSAWCRPALPPETIRCLVWSWLGGLRPKPVSLIEDDQDVI